jgi:hypothetical protein
MVEHHHVEWDPDTRRILTTRLLLRPWQLDDDVAACGIYGAREVSRWLRPALPLITDDAYMRQTLGAWISESDAAGLPLGRWAITDRESGDLIGGWHCFHFHPAAPISRSDGRLHRHCGVTATARKPVMRWPIKHSQMLVSIRSSRSCGQAIIAGWLRRGEWVWNGSVRPISTTT